MALLGCQFWFSSAHWDSELPELRRITRSRVWQVSCSATQNLVKDARRRRQVHLVWLLCGLMFLATAERRLAYLDFDAAHDVRIENNDKPDGDEIVNRLIFVDDSTEPIAPTAGDVCHATLIPVESCGPSLIIVRLSEPRAPPLALPSLV